jgi:hypothetical protein
LQGFEADLLQHNVAIRIGEDFLVNAVAAANLSVDQLIGGDTGLERFVFEGAVAFFLGKEIASVGDDQAQVAGASLVNAGKVDFVQNAVAGGEPDLAVLVQGRAGGGFGARGPARRNAGPAGGVGRRIAHAVFVLGLQLVATVISAGTHRGCDDGVDTKLMNGIEEGSKKKSCAFQERRIMNRPEPIPMPTIHQTIKQTRSCLSFGYGSSPLAQLGFCGSGAAAGPEHGWIAGSWGSTTSSGRSERFLDGRSSIPMIRWDRSARRRDFCSRSSTGWEFSRDSSTRIPSRSTLIQRFEAAIPFGDARSARTTKIEIVVCFLDCRPTSHSSEIPRGRTAGGL